MKIRTLQTGILILFCFFPLRPAHADDSTLLTVSALRTRYQEIEPMLLKNVFNMPLYVESHEEGYNAGVDVYGIVEHPFRAVYQALEMPANWCDIALLHINDKACTYVMNDRSWHLNLYSGRKYYQPPEEAHKLHYVFRVKSQQPDYLALQLIAAEGPLSTKDHKIHVEIIPLGRDKTLLHLSYTFGYGPLGRIAMKSYFATIGRSKVGFSIAGTDEHGNPAYVGGIKGAVERNVVRYYCAIVSYLDSLKFPSDQQFEKRVSRWYDLTDRHKRQLHELEKEQYLNNKRRELKNQLLLQKKAALPAVAQRQ
ncbi:MAG: hypothetical protein HZB31_05115 [Nitrospirae bacterium]|nr:hypothetical protein [Nitrospirota bacterium]